MSYLIGIDDAGRGPLIGPMILGGVLIKREDEPELKKLGAKDSKLLTHPQRISLAGLIRKNIIKEHLEIAFPDEIDAAVLGTENLNTLEARKMAGVINKLNDKTKKITVIVDCPSINTETWRSKLMSFIEHPSNLQVMCEHKADFNHPVVSAASILAKVAREEEVDKIKKKYGNIGSGYPSDPFTQAFIKENAERLKDSGIFRKSWKTWQDLFPSDKPLKKKNQKSILEY